MANSSEMQGLVYDNLQRVDAQVVYAHEGVPNRLAQAKDV
jgi:hypothetical protein